jgi:hypothetical protein
VTTERIVQINVAIAHRSRPMHMNQNPNQDDFNHPNDIREFGKINYLAKTPSILHVRFVPSVRFSTACAVQHAQYFPTQRHSGICTGQEELFFPSGLFFPVPFSNFKFRFGSTLKKINSNARK